MDSSIHDSNLFPIFTVYGSQSMPILHRYGPCSPSKEKEPSIREILAQDYLRVASLQARAARFLEKNDSIAGRSGVSLPTQSSLYLGYNNYVITIGIGTPAKTQTVVIDTGSDLSWIQCKPCTSCYPQAEPIFDPSTSSSYNKFLCTSTACANLYSRSCSNGFCVYSVRYLDGSGTTGYLSSDNLSLTSGDVFSRFIFGCGVKNGGLFRGVAGLFGLGRSSYSLFSQTASTFGNVFSYCLPYKAGSTGYLTLSKSSASGAAYTPMLSSPRAPNLYFIDLIGVSVGGTRLPVTPAVFRAVGTIIDSGTVITRLPSEAYSALRSSFRIAMAGYPFFQLSRDLDTCYDFRNNRTVTTPRITLHYSGLDAVLGANAVFLPVGSSFYCLGFQSTASTGDFGIIGNVQQKTSEVIYDIGAKRIGFVGGACA